MSRRQARFLVIDSMAEQPPPVTQLKIIVNCFSELKIRLVAADIRSL